MSKRLFKKAMRANRVVAIPSRVVRNGKGEIIKEFYNVFKV